MTRSAHLIRTLVRVASDLLSLSRLTCHSRARLAAENLFLRKQLAMYVERGTAHRRADDATRVTLVALSYLTNWRELLLVVKPDTLIRWHRLGVRLFWRSRSRPVGRPCIPPRVQQVIAQMATANVTWGEERIAAELALKLGVHLSPRTVRRYMPKRDPRGGHRSQAWSTFVRNHAHAIVACDFFVAVTARFRLVYVFVSLELGTRRIVHWNLTEHPSATWTIQQLRMFVPGDQPHRFVIHDRDRIFSHALDQWLADVGVTALKTPPRSPQANAYCERLIGTIRRECLDWIIPLNVRHLRHVLIEGTTHYSHARPHSSLGPGIPNLLPGGHDKSCRHSIPAHLRVVAEPILGGLHHEYRVERAA